MSDGVATSLNMHTLFKKSGAFSSDVFQLVASSPAKATQGVENPPVKVALAFDGAEDLGALETPAKTALHQEPQGFDGEAKTPPQKARTNLRKQVPKSGVAAYSAPPPQSH